MVEIPDVAIEAEAEAAREGAPELIGLSADTVIIKQDLFCVFEVFIDSLLGFIDITICGVAAFVACAISTHDNILSHRIFP